MELLVKTVGVFAQIDGSRLLSCWTSATNAWDAFSCNGVPRDLRGLVGRHVVAIVVGALRVVIGLGLGNGFAVPHLRDRAQREAVLRELGLGCGPVLRRES